MSDSQTSNNQMSNNPIKPIAQKKISASSDINDKNNNGNGLTLSVVQADITTLNVDAIVNAANSQLQHGGGIAGAILRNGGYEIQKESDLWIANYGLVDHAHPAVTSGGNLPAGIILHAVGPVWGSGPAQRLDANVLAERVEIWRQRLR